MVIRRETTADVPAIREIHLWAFASEGSQEPVEARLVDELRASHAWIPRLSMVAVVDGGVVGHVVCSRAAIEPGDLPVLALAPIAVLPDRQRAGVGSALMHAVLAAADSLGESLVGLVGEPDFYSRFGFRPASSIALEAPDPSWGDFFQVRTLTCYEPITGGCFRYAASFDSL